jgi:membrane protein DedA with SNARE-associated domain
MSITDFLLAEMSVHGVPLLFGVVAVASVGFPFPVTFTLVAAGSLAKQGEMSLLPIIVAASLAAILGDQVGYGLSRWGGRRLIVRISRRVGGESKIKKAEALSKKWGGPGIFFSRWLITELGPWLNVTSGIAAYPWRRFIIWDVLGEVLWVVLYVMLGYIFSDRVQFISEIMGNLVWAILAFVVATILGWKLFRYFRPLRTGAA